MKAIRIATADAADRVLTLGTSVADGVAGGFSWLSMRTGLGGVEKEWVRFKRPDGSVNDSVIKVNQDGGPVNTFALDAVNLPAGNNGVRLVNSWGAIMVLSPYQLGSPGFLATTNQGLKLEQNANSYDNTTLMLLRVVTSAGMGTVPAFDFDHAGGMNAGQLLSRWRVNGTDVARLRNGGSLVLNAGSANPLGLGDATDLANVADGVKNSTAIGVLGFFNSNNAVYAGLNLGTGVFQASGAMGVGTQIGVGNLSPAAAPLQMIGNLSSAQVVALSRPLFLYAAGSSAITETIRLVGQRGDAGLKCVVVGTEQASPNAACELLRVAKGIGSVANDASNGTALVTFFGNGEQEFSTAGAGVILRSPDNTRWRVTVTNAGVLNVALA